MRVMTIWIGSKVKFTWSEPTIDMETSADEVMHGSCLCGSVAYTTKGEPVTQMLCHCRNCRKATGSAFMANNYYLKRVSGRPIPSFMSEASLVDISPAYSAI